LDKFSRQVPRVSSYKYVHDYFLPLEFLLWQRLFVIAETAYNHHNINRNEFVSYKTELQNKILDACLYAPR
jgi:hypothetical protein